MPIVLKVVSVFVTAFVLDVLWALYIRRTANGHAAEAGMYAATLMLLGAYNTLSFVQQPWLLAPIAAGAWLGTYFIVRREHRGGSK